MLTLICLILFFSIFGSIIKLAFKATWGLTKIIWRIILLPALLLVLILSGIYLVAIPVLIIAGIVVLRKLFVRI